MNYHDDKSRVSNSSLKLFARAPILWKRWREGTLIEKKTPEMIFGSLLHCLEFEPWMLSELFCITPTEPKRPTKAQLKAFAYFDGLLKPTKAQIEANEKTTEMLLFWDKFDKANEGKERIEEEDVTKAHKCLAGLQADPKCRDFLALTGLSEKVIEWIDEATGLPCKAKMDRITRHAILDLKSAADASADGFKNAAFRMGYHRQAAWYLDGIGQAIKQGTLSADLVELFQGVAPEVFIFTVVEKDDEHLAHCFPCEADFIQRGRVENALLMRELKHCITTGRWPGLSRNESGMTPLGIPSFTPDLPL